MHYDITMVGHICKDTLIDLGKKTESLGGAVYFSSLAAVRSGADVQVVTKAAERDDGLLDPMRREGIGITRLDDEDTTSITLVYDSPDRERRKLVLETQAGAFDVTSLPDIPSSIYHLAGLFKGEIPDDFITHLSSRGSVALDVQGVLRCSEEGKLHFRPWDRARELLPLVSFLKTDAAEAEILTGEKDREKAALMLNGWGAGEVMVTHNREVLLVTGGKLYRAPFNPANLSGRTGRGDTTFAAYLAKRLTAGPEESLFYAAALCSIKMESPGPFAGSVKDVLERMEQIGYLSAQRP